MNTDPKFQHIHKEAKRLLKDARNGDPKAIAVIRAAFPDSAPDADIGLKDWLKLSRAQHAYAVKCRHRSWRHLLDWMKGHHVDPAESPRDRSRRRASLKPAAGPIKMNFDGSEAITVGALQELLEAYPANFYVSFSGGLSLNRLKVRDVNHVDIELNPTVWFDPEEKEVYVDDLDYHAGEK